MADTLSQAWHTATKDIAVWLIRALITTLAVTAMWRFWERIRKVVWPMLGWADAKPAANLEDDWRDRYLVRVWPIPVIRKGLLVTEGTRVVVYDHGLVQFELPAGRYSGREMSRRLAKHAVCPDAVALQLPDAGMRVEGAVASTAIEKGAASDRGRLRVGLAVDAQAVGRITKSPLLKNGVLSKEDVFDLIDGSMVSAFSPSGASLDQVSVRIHEQLGLIGLVHTTVPSVHTPPGTGEGSHG